MDQLLLRMCLPNAFVFWGGWLVVLCFGVLFALVWGFMVLCVCFGLFFRFLENKVINKIISLLHTLWLTNLGDKREKKNQSQEKRKLLPIQLVNEFLYVLVTFIKPIR